MIGNGERACALSAPKDLPMTEQTAAPAKAKKSGKKGKKAASGKAGAPKPLSRAAAAEAAPA